MEKKYKVGDMVRVRADLDKCDPYEEPIIVPGMRPYAGKVFKIASISHGLYYTLEVGDNYDVLDGQFMWNAEWFDESFAESIKIDISNQSLNDFLK